MKLLCIFSKDIIRSIIHYISQHPCFFVSLIKYSWFIAVCSFLVYSKVIHTHTQTHIYMSSFSYSFPLWFITWYWIYFTGLYSRTLLFMYFIYNSLYLLIPNSKFIPSPSAIPFGHCKVFSYMYQSVYVL